MKQLGSPLLDSVHMSLGIVTEIVDELPVAVHNLDYVNISEEIGDAFWYLANYSNIWNLEVGETKVHSSKLEVADDLKSHYQLIESGLQLLMNYSAKLADLDKKAFAYNKQINIEDRQYLFTIITLGLEGMCTKFNLDSDLIREKNINKLKVRYPDKFTDDYANNRDLKAEYKTLV
jgi:NTP pyrophosphatase (non-canonical NTP hydrolase)